MKPLRKQILSEKDSVSFIPEKFNSDNEVLLAIEEYYNNHISDIDSLTELLQSLNTYNANGIFIKSGAAVSDISNAAFNSWNVLRLAWNEKYEALHPVTSTTKFDKYIEKRDKVYKSIKSFSLFELQELGAENGNEITDWYISSINECNRKIKETYLQARELLKSDYEKDYDKRLYKNEKATELVKNLLDAIKKFQQLVKPLNGTGKEENKDELFYGKFTSFYDSVADIDRLYDKVRNYITQKPYSKDKIKLNFDNPTFLKGWALGNEFANSAQLLRDGDNYYLAIMDKEFRNNIPKKYNSPISKEDVLQKIIYQQAADPSKDIPNLLVIDGVTVKKNGRKEKTGIHAGENIILENLRNTYLPENINRIRKEKTFLTSSENFSKDDLCEYIQYYICRAQEYYSSYNFTFKNASEYKSFQEFLDDVNSQAYQISYDNISKNKLWSL